MTTIEDGVHFAARRARVLERLAAGNAALVLPAAPELRFGRDQELRYRPDPDLFYLTGYPEPEAVAVLAPAHEAARFTLFVRPRDPRLELWTGRRGGAEAARERYGADAAHPISELESRLPALLNGAATVYAPLGSGHRPLDALLRRLAADARRQRQRTGRGLRVLADPGLVLDELRLHKDAHEIERIRAAARITAEGFRDAARAVRPGAGEWEVEAALEAGFRRRGAEGVGFASIVASGPNATVLHYIENARTMRAGELLLLDAGAAVRMYNGDISRTLPVSGRFSPAQRELYDLVLAALRAALAEVRPGSTVAAAHDAAVRTLVEGLVGLGLLEGETEALVEAGAHRAFFPHQTSHWLGLDVHDVGDYALDGRPRPLAPGMVLTLEPGLYLPDDADAVPPEMRGIGIRLEEDVLVTADGADVLTADLPLALADIEQWMRDSA